jgi:hypothetical protein
LIFNGKMGKQPFQVSKMGEAAKGPPGMEILKKCP